MLGSQVAVGDSRVGISYTLTSVTGGRPRRCEHLRRRGSFIGALFGALLIQEIITSTAFLQIGHRVAVLPARAADPFRRRDLFARPDGWER